MYFIFNTSNQKINKNYSYMTNLIVISILYSITLFLYTIINNRPQLNQNIEIH